MGFDLGAALGLTNAIGLPFVGAIAQDQQNQYNRKEARHQEAVQREFATQGVRWKVEDAKAAGIHPLFALGASTQSYSPVSTGDYQSPLSSMAEMGQNLSRAAMSTATQEEKTMQQLNIAGAKLDLEGKALDNQIRASQLKNLQAPGTPLGTPSNSWLPGMEGQGNAASGAILKPAEITMSAPGRYEQEAGTIPSVSWMRNSSGGLSPMPSKDAKERMEDMFWEETKWQLRNSLGPNLGTGSVPPQSYLPKGYTHWEWDFASQSYVPSKIDPKASFHDRMDTLSNRMIYKLQNKGR